jgi:hypothetical protein
MSIVFAAEPLLKLVLVAHDKDTGGPAEREKALA